MDGVLTDRQRRFLALAEPLARRFAERAAQHDAAGSFPHENFADLRAAGLTGLTAPEECGGMGADELEYTLTLERMAWGDASTALALGMSLSNIGQIAEGGLWPDHAPTLFREAARDGAMLNAAQAEPEMGSPSYGGLPATTARRDPSGGWRLNGRKIYTTGAPGLRYFIVMATIQEDGQPPRIGDFLTPSDAPGLRIEETWNALALRASGSHDVVLDDVLLSENALLGARAPGQPDPRAALGLPWGSLTLAAVYNGAAQAARDEIVHFAATRKPTALGKPLGELPNVRAHLGEIDALLLASRRVTLGLAADWVAAPAEARPALRQQGPLVKVIATTNAVRITDIALRIAGGQGLQRGKPLERIFRDVRAGLVNAPIEDVVLQNAGKAAVDATIAAAQA
ncbi:MAG TPA: acyl-CoA dehydrogenase family protein [Ktedonobacterales bacterium]|nr:acyl-CoA dehydrogenase family protein [Ktedonobacterales bacterium]